MAYLGDEVMSGTEMGASQARPAFSYCEHISGYLRTSHIILYQLFLTDETPIPDPSSRTTKGWQGSGAVKPQFIQSVTILVVPVCGNLPLLGICILLFFVVHTTSLQTLGSTSAESCIGDASGNWSSRGSSSPHTLTLYYRIFFQISLSMSRYRLD